MLDLTQGNLSEAAKRAGMDRKNFWQKAKRHNIKKSNFRGVILKTMMQPLDADSYPLNNFCKPCLMLVN